MEERCPNCGYCKHCGRSGGYQVGPYVPTYPNWTVPYWTGTNPNFTVSSVTPSTDGINPIVTS